jgi:hypothetical protein
MLFAENNAAWANLTLKVNAKSTAYNTINYLDSTGKSVSYSLPWKEKAQYDTATGTGQIKPSITVTNAAVGDLIIKLDVLMAYPAISNTMEVRSYWLKYASIPSPLGYVIKAIELVENGHAATGSSEILDKNKLSTLCLQKQVPKNEVITLMDFISESFPLPAHIIFTAILVDDVNANQQVIGVDIQSVYFGRKWKELIQCGN